MKKLIVMLLLMGVAMTAMAQQIAVVYESGTMRTCNTLLQAVRNATDGCVIYLPAGGFQIGDTVRINHRVSIIGLNHKSKSLNADGMTSISGNLFFDEGSSGSVVMGCYISGSVKIGYDGNAVHNIFVRYCNVNSVDVQNSLCTGTTINQCYVRSTCYFNGAPAIMTHNIMSGVSNLIGGVLDYNNIVTGSINASNSTISNNIFLILSTSCNTCQVRNNMQHNSTWGDDYISMSEAWSDIFMNPLPGISSNANFHFKDDFKEWETKVGIYAGKSAGSINYFHDDALPPVPYVQAKVVPESTDFDGKINVTLTVKDGSK